MRRVDNRRRIVITRRAAHLAILGTGAILLLLGTAFAVTSVRAAGQASGPAGAPLGLAATGLYSDFATRTIDAHNLHYSPQYPLWSDGAAKQRWIRLPEETAIDATDPDAWAFPVGTRVWKEFSFNGHRVETRMMEATEDGDWRFASYVWNADESDAVLAPVQGLRDVVVIQPGIRHNIPSVLDCRVCHEGDRVEVLGVSALQLSPDRDPNAPHAEPPTPDMVDLRSLIRRGLLRAYPPEWGERLPRVEAKNATIRAALGYLHANCGNCHGPSNPLASLGMILRHSVAPGAVGEPALATTLDRTGEFTIPGATRESSVRLRPGDPTHSTILVRMSSRNPLHQMPPLGTKLADADAIALIRRWILDDLPRE